MSRVFSTLALSVIAGILFSATPVMAKGGWMSACKGDIHKHCKGKKGDEAKECLKAATGVSEKCTTALNADGGAPAAAMEKKDAAPAAPAAQGGQQ
jgi:hypothetical protein